MPDPEPHFFRHQYAPSQFQKIAYIKTVGSKNKPGIVWLPGFMSTMSSTKITALAYWCTNNNYSMLRFDYSGHGQSEGNFEDGTISQWLEQARSVVEQLSSGPQILVGSSMGSWISLLLLRYLNANSSNHAGRIKGMVLIAPAWDMTKRLMWERFSDEIRNNLATEGVYYRPSQYEDGPYPITMKLIEDGRQHLIGSKPFKPGCPIRILHGMQDEDVPWKHSEELISLLEADDIVLSLIKDGDHRLSREQDIARLYAEIEILIKNTTKP